MAHADETDDSHEASGTHPGCAIVPAALAVAERANAAGRAFLNGVVAGYDVGCRMNLALDTELLAKSNHSTHAIGGLFGAAAAASSVLGLPEASLRYVFDYAGQQASGVRYWVRDQGTSRRRSCSAACRRNGVTAAVLVQAGFTGVSDCLSSENNF
jgi:2-methylcitrate dehydratase PrpD